MSLFLGGLRGPKAKAHDAPVTDPRISKGEDGILLSHSCAIT